MTIGYISIHRKIRENWIFDNAEYFKAWITILMEVNFKDSKMLIEGELIECKRGQSLHSLAGWAKSFGNGWTVQKVRTFFKLLESDGNINTEGLRKTTRLTVCNYSTYQDIQQADNTESNRQPTDSQHGDNRQPTGSQQHLNNLNKENNENKENNGREREWEYAHSIESILNNFPLSERAKESQIEFDTYLRQKGTHRIDMQIAKSLKLLVEHIEKYGEDAMIKRTDEAIAKGWGSIPAPDGKYEKPKNVNGWSEDQEKLLDQVLGGSK